MSKNTLPPVEVLTHRVYEWSKENLSEPWESTDAQMKQECLWIASTLRDLMEQMYHSVPLVAEAFGVICAHGFGDITGDRRPYVSLATTLIPACILPPLTKEEQEYVEE